MNFEQKRVYCFTENCQLSFCSNKNETIVSGDTTFQGSNRKLREEQKTISMFPNINDQIAVPTYSNHNLVFFECSENTSIINARNLRSSQC
mgnify:CR=1 FL=1